METKEDLIKSLLNPTKKSKKTVLSQLYKRPVKDKGLDAPFFPHITPNYMQQADLLYLPNDAGYIYALVIVDVGSRLVDAEPLKVRDSTTVLKAIKKIYRRKILLKPKVINVDQGAEFKSTLPALLKPYNIMISYAKAGRHRQVALAERKNQTIGKIIHKLIVHEELKTKQASSAWVSSLGAIVSAINVAVKKKMQKLNEKKENKVEDMTPLFEGKTLKLLSEGDKVRVQLDEPIDTHGKKLNGKFRLSDIRWNPKIRTIKYVLMKPDAPVTYLLDGSFKPLMVENVGYTKNQLQLVIDPVDNQPVIPIDKPDVGQYTVQKILEKKKEKGVIYFLVKWREFRKATWEKRSELIKDIPQAIKKFENKLKVEH